LKTKSGRDGLAGDPDPSSDPMLKAGSVARHCGSY